MRLGEIHRNLNGRGHTATYYCIAHARENSAGSLRTETDTKQKEDNTKSNTCLPEVYMAPLLADAVLVFDVGAWRKSGQDPLANETCTPHGAERLGRARADLPRVLRPYKASRGGRYCLYGER